MFQVTVIGGGAAGCLAAVEIHKNNPQYKILIFERDPGMLVRGTAYSSHFVHQPLNVRVKGMSADPDNPDDFENWLIQNQKRYADLKFDRSSFITRSIYGDYLEEYFTGMKNNSNGKISVCENNVSSVLKSNTGFLIKTSNGNYETEKLVLATGNFLPKELPVSLGNVSDAHYFRNPWKNDLFEKIAGNSDVFIVGSGLTAVDIVLGLRAKNHSGKIHLLSRRGYLPLPHKEPVKHFFSESSDLLSGDIYKVFSAIREEVKFLHDRTKDWQDVIDSMRAFTSIAWQKLSVEHKSIFLKRLKPFWEIHRHRIPKRSQVVIEDMIAEGILFRHQGELCSIEKVGNTVSIGISKENKVKKIDARFIVNCTGPDSDFKSQNSALYNNLFSEFELDTDPFHLGLNCTPEGKLIGKNGLPINNLFCIGSLRKGILWETTAVSDIRMQAKEIATKINSYL